MTRTPERLREIPVLLDKAPVRYSRTAAEACLKAADEIQTLHAVIAECIEALKASRHDLVIVAENGGSERDPVLRTIKKIDKVLKLARSET